MSWQMFYYEVERILRQIVHSENDPDNQEYNDAT